VIDHLEHEVHIKQQQRNAVAFVSDASHGQSCHCVLGQWPSLSSDTTAALMMDWQQLNVSFHAP
jgi:hypothetical protein